MKQSPSQEAKSTSANREIPCIIWYTKVYIRVHKGQINPVHALPSYFFKFYFNIFLPSTPSSCKFPLPPYVAHTYPMSFLI